MMGNHWRLVSDWSPIDRRTVADQTMFTKMSPTSLVFDAATNTSRRPNCSDNQSPTGRRSFADHRKPPKTTPKKVVVGGRREVVDVILWQPIADWSAIIDKHLPTSDNLQQPPKKSGCQRSATGCHYSVTMALGIIWKPIYFNFNWYIICYDCPSGTCASDYIRRNVKQ